MSQNSVFDEEEILLDDGSPGPSKRTKYNSHTAEMKLTGLARFPLNQRLSVLGLVGAA